MKLATLFTHLHQRAVATGQWHGAELPGGARVDVKITDGTTQVIFSRLEKRVGTTELTTFKLHCAIPDDASRDPADPVLQNSRVTDDGKTRFYVRYHWPTPVCPNPEPSPNAAQPAAQS